MKFKQYSNAHQALLKLTERLIGLINEKETEPFHLALSGGETAQVLFTLWQNEYQTLIPWNRIRFYWVDERCVAPTSPESNFYHASQLLFKPLNIPHAHIHRIQAEGNPEAEAMRYTELIKKEVPLLDGMPFFDCMLLGIGSDLHTASIFTSSMQLLTDERCYALSVHPVSQQARITMTGPLILTAATLLVPVLGPAKAEVVKALLYGTGSANTPAGYIMQKALNAVLFTNCQI